MKTPPDLKFKFTEVPVRELVKGYRNDEEEGVVGYGGELNIRPPYQREFIYKDVQRDAVINTVRRGFPLNIMYWAKSSNTTYELLDGQQRTLSICEYVVGKFSLNYQYFHNLEDDEKEEILDFKLMVYFCDGSDSEKLDWFKTINIAGEKLSTQELRNAIYTGTWLTDAKRHFSKSKCPAHNLASDYLRGLSIRQEYLETAIEWISNGNIEEYMALHQHKPNANELWLYFQSVISWFKVVFPNYRREMKGLPLGILYNEFKDTDFDSKAIEKRIVGLMQDENVTKKPGIYPYILSNNNKYLNIRAFSPNQRREAYELQAGNCIVCGNHFDFTEMEADHITPWHEGGETSSENCQMLCKHDNRRKSGK